MKEAEPSYDEISRLAFAGWVNERRSPKHGLQFWLDWHARTMSLNAIRRYAPAAKDHAEVQAKRRAKTVRAT